MKLTRNNRLPVQTKQSRKNYSALRKHVEREMNGFVQGRLDANVFVRHYYIFLLIELRKVLGATKGLEDELLRLLTE